MKKEKSLSDMDLVQIRDGSAASLHRQVAFELLLLLSLSIGCWSTFFSMFPNPVNRGLSLILITGVPIIVYGLSRNRFLGSFLVVYVFLFAAVFFALAYESVWNGFLVMGNIIVEVMNDRMQTGWIEFELTGTPENWEKDALLAMIPVITLVSTGIAYSVYHKEPVPAMVMTAIPVMTGLCLKIEPSLWLLLLLVAAWTGLITVSAVKGPLYEDLPGRRGRKRRTIWLDSGKDLSIPFMLLGGVIILLMGFIVILSGDDYEPPQKIDDIRAETVRLEEHLRYENLTGDKTDEMPSGDLNSAKALEYTDAEVMQIQMQKAQSMHLRGFVGGSFSQGRWVETPDSAYAGEYLGITEWLAQRNFYPWMQREHLLRIDERNRYMDVRITNTNTSSKYIYLPYEAAMSGDTMADKINYRRDLGAYAKGVRGQRNYSFKLFESDKADYDQQGIEILIQAAQSHPDWQKYADSEAVYRKFVYDTYLLMDEKDERTIASTGIGSCDGKSIGYTLYFIRKMFADDYRLSLKTEAKSEERNELNYFLSKSHKGDEMHFATAAALMFRHTGIPARYVEGYYLPPDEAESYAGMNDVQISVPDSWNHAWVEIYIDGYGWQPVEVVPGYYELEKSESVKTEEQQEHKETGQAPKHKEASVEDNNEKSGGEEDRSLLTRVIPAVIIFMIAAWLLFGRRRVRNRWAEYSGEPSEQTVYKIYRYTKKVFAFGGCSIGQFPSDSRQSVQKQYPGFVAEGFDDFVRMAESVRFGDHGPDEQHTMAEYAKKTAEEIYIRQNRWKKFIMKFILWYV